MNGWGRSAVRGRAGGGLFIGRLAVGGVAVGGLAALLGWAAPIGRLTHPTPGGAGLVIAAVGAAAWGSLAWLVLGVGLVLMARLPGVLGRLAARCAAAVTPAALREALAVAAAATLGATAGGAGPAFASPLGAGSLPAHEHPGGGLSATPREKPPNLDWSGEPAPTPVSPTPKASPRPHRPAVSRSRDAPKPSESGAPPQGGRSHGRPVPGRHKREDVRGHPRRPPEPPRRPVVTVRAGDTLWTIAARHLGRTATPAEIAAAWPRWYAANRHTIGSDPNLIFPGQVLVAPPPG